jgi:hypothetical protein
MRFYTWSVSIPTLGDPLVSFIQTWYQTRCGETIERKAIWQNREKSLKINIERLYMDIEQAASGDFSSSVGAASILIKEYIFHSLAGMCYYCLSRNHENLANLIVSHPGEYVISFNWDVLIDEAMYRTGKWSYRDGYGIPFSDIRYSDGENDEEKLNIQNITSSNVIIKPHGSINWYKKRDSEAPIFLGLQLQDIGLRGGTTMMQDAGISIESEFYPTGMIPPGSKRRGYEPIWKAMKTILEQVDDVVAIGFSFNDNDEHVRDYFKRVQYKQPLRIIMVNPDQKLKSVYRDIFRTKEVDQYSNIKDFLGNG